MFDVIVKIVLSNVIMCYSFLKVKVTLLCFINSNTFVYVFNIRKAVGYYCEKAICAKKRTVNFRFLLLVLTVITANCIQFELQLTILSDFIATFIKNLALQDLQILFQVLTIETMGKNSSITLFIAIVEQGCFHGAELSAYQNKGLNK